VGDCRRDPSRHRRSPGRTWRDLNGAGGTLCAEVEEGGELAALVVAPEHEDGGLELDLDGQDEA
jgi:hypothetical protein